VQDRAKAQEMGAVGFIKKPVKKTELLAKVERLVT